MLYKLNNLTDQEKSVILARATGWFINPVDDNEWVYHLPDGTTWRTADDLYHDGNMALAWRVHLWALKQRNRSYWNYCANGHRGAYVWEYADAQRLWLDKILALAIEAGLTEVNNDISVK